jgi:hypothetical protein
MPAHSLLGLWRLPLHPAEDRRCVDLYAPLLHPLSQIAIGNAVLAVPANTKHDDLNGKAPTLEDDPSYRPGPALAFSAMVTATDSHYFAYVTFPLRVRITND